MKKRILHVYNTFIYIHRKNEKVKLKYMLVLKSKLAGLSEEVLAREVIRHDMTYLCLTKDMTLDKKL